MKTGQFCTAEQERRGHSTPMSELTKLYQHHAKDCLHAAELTDNPKYREPLLKMAAEWTEAAALRASNGSKPPSK
jgi:hypothetical protein